MLRNHRSSRRIQVNSSITTVLHTAHLAMWLKTQGRLVPTPVLRAISDAHASGGSVRAADSAYEFSRRFSFKRLPLENPRAIGQGMFRLNLPALDGQAQRSGIQAQKGGGFRLVHPPFR